MSLWLEEYKNKTLSEIFHLEGSQKEAPQADLIGLFNLFLAEILGTIIEKKSFSQDLIMPTEGKSERKRMTIEEFDKYLEGEDLNELLHRARRKSEAWLSSHGIATLALSLSNLIEDGLKYHFLQKEIDKTLNE